ncbi:MAG: 1,4-dihydroxy-2-naphthoate octaprenyltransferase [Candidatus Omnitrophota bacterium]|nr:1,4-dihydroxy-2-naphthoate octaprenyltransferase [Candidatus Omnitrophota bacterium]
MINSKFFPNRIAVWLKAMRLPFLTATIVPVIFGSVIAWHNTGEFIWMRFWLVILGASLIHIGTNLANDYFDHLSGADKANPNPTPFSGGSRVIQDGLILPKKILYASLSAFILGSLIGFYLNYLCGQNVILILGAIGIFLGFFYSARPFFIGYRSFGELAVGVGFGPLMVMGAYFVQARNLPFSVFLISIPVGILIALVVFINEFLDYVSDKSVEKNTLVVVLGRKRAITIYHILLLLTYLYVAFLVISRIMPLFCLIVFFSLPLVLKAFTVSRNNFERVYELLPANASTIGLHSIFGFLLCIAYVLDKILVKLWI